MASKTVKFNVGGKHFEVSRALIDRHSDTMLGKLVSDAWQEDPEETVFIDRDGDIFACVLNYLRYGSIDLPVTVPKSMFDREINSVEGAINQESLPKSPIPFFMPKANLNERVATLEDRMSAMNARMEAQWVGVRMLEVLRMIAQWVGVRMSEVLRMAQWVWVAMSEVPRMIAQWVGVAMWGVLRMIKMLFFVFAVVTSFLGFFWILHICTVWVRAWEW